MVIKSNRGSGQFINSISVPSAMTTHDFVINPSDQRSMRQPHTFFWCFRGVDIKSGGTKVGAQNYFQYVRVGDDETGVRTSK
jgi:hypothetical protein